MKTTARRSTPASGPALMAWRRERGISREVFAEMADFSVRKLATYEKAKLLPAKVVRPVTETVRLIGALGELAGDQEALTRWLHAPNRAFGKRSPMDLIKAGESDEIWQMVHQLREGSFA